MFSITLSEQLVAPRLKRNSSRPAWASAIADCSETRVR